jgi:ABC-2 type transport system permease protein
MYFCQSKNIFISKSLSEILMKNKVLLGFVVCIFGIVLMNVFASNLNFRIDLTQDKRYTISPATESFIENLPDEVFVRVYLEGDGLPADFKRLRNTIQEQLEEFQRVSGKNIKFRFIDPFTVEPASKRDSLMRELSQKGIKPTNIFVTQEGKKIEKLVFPGALLTYKGKETAVLFLKGDQRATVANPAEILNQSVENVEYELASAIRRVAAERNKKIGFLLGNGELSPLQITDAAQALQQYYQVFPVDLGQSQTLDGLDAIIVAKPDSIFSEKDKYKIDQFIMKGGKALFFIDALDIREDSLTTLGKTVSFPYNHNLIDLFFRYGVRFNYDFIEDLNAGVLGLIVGNMGGEPQMQYLPWRHYPLLSNFFPHPIGRNLDALYTRYVSTLDTVRADGIKKTPLVTTSPYTRVVNSPIIIELNEASLQPKPEEYKAGAKTVAYLLEGKFTSLYKNRLLKDDPRYKTFIEKGRETKILIVSDGDFIKNDVNSKGMYAPLGFDKNTGITFANKKFLLNATDYLLDDKGLILARNKAIKARPLDKQKMQTQRLKWQLINVALPIVVLALLGVIYAFLRKRKYGK